MIIKIGKVYFEHVAGDQISFTLFEDKAHRFPLLDDAADRGAWLADWLGIERELVKIEMRPE